MARIRPQQARLTHPLNADQVEKLDAMLEDLFKAVRSDGALSVHVDNIVGLIDLETQVEGILPVENGGTGNDETPPAGAIAYGTGAILDWSAVGTSGQVLLSGGAGAPTWDTFSIDDLSDVTITSAASGDLLRFNGSVWVNVTSSAAVEAAGNWENLTNGDAEDPEIIFADGDVVMAWNPA